ncbi:MAG: DUF480 domain-containing protein [Planctomycetota bacterium]
MESHLNPYEARVLGVLIEKAYTTPDQYPLSLNATTNACNQKSCRNPVVDYSEAEVLVTLKGLRMKHIAGGSIPAGSRIERWHHSAKEHWGLSDASLAVLAELLLRGPQSAAALRSNASRMITLASPEELQKAIGPLEDKRMVHLLPPGGGSRVAQYECTLGATAEGPVAAPARPTLSMPSHVAPAPAAPEPDALAALTERVARLEQQLADLAGRLGETL